MKSFHPYAMTTIVFWSLAHVFTRLSLQHFTPYSLGFLRYLFASVALVAVVFVLRVHPPAKKDWGWFALGGAVGFFLYIIVFNKGTSTVTASTSSVVIATVPVLTALLARIVYKEKLRARQWVAIAVEFVGILVLTLLNGVFSINPGVLWLSLGALLLSSYNLLQRRLTKTYTALQVSTYNIFAGTLMLGIFAPTSFPELAQASALPIFYVICLGVFSSAVAYICWAKAISMAEKVSAVSNYMFITPFLTTLLGILLAAEVPDLATLAGGAIILAGVFLFNYSGREVAVQDNP